MKYWYQYQPWNFTHREVKRGTWHIIRRHSYQIDVAQWRMVQFGTPRLGRILTPNIDPSMKDWYGYQTLNLTNRVPFRNWSHVIYHTTVLLINRAQLRESMHMTYDTTALPLRKNIHMIYHTTSLLKIAAAQWPMVHFWTQGSVLSTLEILDPSMKDWYHYQPCNLTLRAQLRESRHMTDDTKTLPPNSWGWSISGPQWMVLLIPQIFDTSMNDW